jgi:2-furoyl-CoA dehydrogenase FAD binding subunit
LKPAAFAYVRPDSVDEALFALARYGADGRVIAGGQSLGAMLNMRLVRPAAVIDINDLDELSAISLGERTLTTGAMVRQADALADAHIRAEVPLLARALPHVGHYQTRNRGTLGGSVAHADPSAEIPLVLATLGGEIELKSRRGRRRLAASTFFRSALDTVREGDELITALHWPRAAAGMKYAFCEFAVREGDYAIVAIACAIDDTKGRVRLGFGGCGGAPQIKEAAWPKGGAEDAVIDTVANEAAAAIDCRSDVLAAADYRRHLAVVLARQALAAARGQGGSHA